MEGRVPLPSRVLNTQLPERESLRSLIKTLQRLRRAQMTLIAYGRGINKVCHAPTNTPAHLYHVIQNVYPNGAIR